MKTSRTSALKYRIHYHLNQLNNQDYEIAWKFLPWRCGMAASTFKSYVYIKADEPKTIPGDHLLIMAVFFQCSVADLYEEQPTTESLAKDFAAFKVENYPNHIYSNHFKTALKDVLSQTNSEQ